jgi:hypothetical protein
LARLSVVLPPYADGPNTAIVSRKPRLDSIRGGASGMATCTTSANAVSSVMRRRAKRYSAAGRRHHAQARNPSVIGKWTVT